MASSCDSDDDLLAIFVVLNECRKRKLKKQPRKPAYEMAETDPDWAPTLKLGHKYEQKPSSRGPRLQARRERKKMAEAAQTDRNIEEKEEVDLETEEADLETEDLAAETENTEEMREGTEKTCSDGTLVASEGSDILEEHQSTNGAVVCSEHFTSQDIRRSIGSTRRNLKPGAVPSVFQFPDQSSNKKVREAPKDRMQKSALLLEVPGKAAPASGETESADSASCSYSTSHSSSHPQRRGGTVSLNDQPPKKKLRKTLTASEVAYQGCESAVGKQASPYQIAPKANQPANIMGPVFTIQLANPNLNYCLPRTSVEDQLQGAQRRIAELEGLLAREKAAQFGRGKLAEKPNSRGRPQTAGPQQKSFASRPEALHLLQASKGPQPCLPAGAKFTVLLIVPQEKALLSQLCPMKAQSSEEEVCQSSLQQNLSADCEEVAVPTVVVKKEPVEESGDAQCYCEQVVTQTAQESAELLVEVKMEAEAENSTVSCYEEREMHQTPQQFATFPVEVKMEPVGEDGNTQCFEEREVHETPQDFGVLSVEVKMESAEEGGDIECFQETEVHQTPQEFATLPVEVKMEPCGTF